MNDSESCGCGGCGCGNSDNSGLTITMGAPQGTNANAKTHTTLKINGMTCGHCVAAVTSELRGIDGVTDVEVILAAGGASTAEITSLTPLDGSLLAQAIDEAGYSLA